MPTIEEKISETLTKGAINSSKPIDSCSQDAINQAKENLMTQFLDLEHMLTTMINNMIIETISQSGGKMPDKIMALPASMIQDIQQKATLISDMSSLAGDLNSIGFIGSNAPTGSVIGSGLDVDESCEGNLGTQIIMRVIAKFAKEANWNPAYLYDDDIVPMFVDMVSLPNNEYDEFGVLISSSYDSGDTISSPTSPVGVITSYIPSPREIEFNPSCIFRNISESEPPNFTYTLELKNDGFDIIDDPTGCTPLCKTL